MLPYRDANGKMLLANISAAAKQADAVVLALGERPYTEGLGNTSDLTLPADQQQLAQAAQASGKPTVLVVIGGRPNIIRGVAEGSSAIIWAGLPGYGGATALAEIISGKTNPSGKLPFTYPQFAGHITNYHHDNNENSLDLSDFGAGYASPGAKYKSAMLTEFGEGLSYTTYAYSGLALSDSVLTGPAAKLRATVRVANTGPRAGQETVLWFLTDEIGRVARPVRILKRFEKQAFAAGQSQQLTFDIDPLRDLSYPDGQGRPQLETGWYTLRVGSQMARFRYVAGPVASATPATGKATGAVRPVSDQSRTPTTAASR
jgi:beta-glucosidase